MMCGMASTDTATAAAPDGARRTTKRGARGVRSKARSVPVKVRVDPARKRRFEALVRLMRRAGRREAGGFDEYWEAVGEILDGELYVAGGYESARAFVEGEVKETLRTAQRMVRVARHASPVEEEKYGTAIVDAAFAYMEAKSGRAIGEKLARACRARPGARDVDRVHRPRA